MSPYIVLGILFLVLFTTKRLQSLNKLFNDLWQIVINIGPREAIRLAEGIVGMVTMGIENLFQFHNVFPH